MLHDIALAGGCPLGPAKVAGRSKLHTPRAVVTIALEPQETFVLLMESTIQTWMASLRLPMPDDIVDTRSAIEHVLKR